MKNQMQIVPRECYLCTKKEGASFMCGSSNYEGFHCTREKSHLGSHVACGFNEHEIRIWSSKKSAGYLSSYHQPNSRLRDPE
ncbi:hypothetical protein LCGC14_0483900 [marine sediment metagenome]|uniref:Uncharacterized protein n=1 Tax=marine sediment metagenome TaxID=412755 RepID=A0A0F9SDX3_9ZZZZ